MLSNMIFALNPVKVLVNKQNLLVPIVNLFFPFLTHFLLEKSEKRSTRVTFSMNNIEDERKPNPKITLASAGK